MKHINQYISIILLVAGVHIVSPQEVLKKQMAVELALQNNFDIQIAENNAQIAENNAGILNSGYLPSITGNAGAAYNKDNLESTFRDGNTVELNGAETTRYNASINLNYTLFDGLGRLYNYKTLKERSALSELQVRETIENTILQLFSVYYEVARITENVANLKKTLAISKDRYTRAKYQNEYGQNTGLDLLNVQVDVNTDSINLINAEQALRNAKRDLNLVLNRDLSTAFEVDTLVAFIPDLVMEDLYKQAKINNVQLLQTAQGLKINDYTIKSLKGNYLPSIGLTGSYGWNKNNNNSASFVTQSTSNGLSVGASLTWNLFDGGRTITSVKNAKITYENQELLQQQTEMQVERNIKNAWETYKNTLYVLEVQKQNVLTNQDNFDRTQERYKIGQVTSLEFRQAQLNLLNAINAQNQAKYTAKLAELQVLQVSGQLLNIAF
ncbi:TolC family protein [Leptobacterium sp. I13]|uniref:TolC family protein n=1 Tax=Leptobacterium meishanense TaxID=3128904 RepID=UPI0030EE0ABB